MRPPEREKLAEQEALHAKLVVHELGGVTASAIRPLRPRRFHRRSAPATATQIASDRGGRPTEVSTTRARWLKGVTTMSISIRPLHPA